VNPGSLTLEHVRQWQKEMKRAGLAELRPISPLLLPDYARQPYDYLPEYTRQILAAGQTKPA